jgi:hypothetical protein
MYHPAPPGKKQQWLAVEGQSTAERQSWVLPLVQVDVLEHADWTPRSTQTPQHAFPPQSAVVSQAISWSLGQELSQLKVKGGGPVWQQCWPSAKLQSRGGWPTGPHVTMTLRTPARSSADERSGGEARSKLSTISTPLFGSGAAPGVSRVAHPVNTRVANKTFIIVKFYAPSTAGEPPTRWPNSKPLFG